MSNAGPVTGNISTLCRCGRTTSLDDDRVNRRRLNCGHYICSDCWHYGQPMPAPVCSTCTITLQHGEVKHISKLYNDLITKFNDLNSGYARLHLEHTQLRSACNQQMHKLKDTMNSSLGRGHPTANKSQSTANTSQSTANISYSTANTSHPQVHPPARPQTHAQPVSRARNVTSPPIASTSNQTFDWKSDTGKVIIATMDKHKQETFAAKNELRITQGEREALKKRIIELTAQLEAKSKPDLDTVTAIDKAELLEAELEDLNVRLDKCESDLDATQVELAEAKARSAELESENEQQKEKLDSDHAVMQEAKSSLASLHDSYQKLEKKLLQSQAALRTNDTTLSSGPDTSQTSVDSPISDKVLGKRREIQSPTPADWKKSATTIAALQKEVWRFKSEKATLDKELSELRQRVKALEEENSALGKKLHTSADVAAELSKLHIAANERSANAESKLQTVQQELKRAKGLLVVREREKQDLEIAAQAAQFSRQAEFMARIKPLEVEIAELVKSRDTALAQIDDWEENRGMWKRWGETMALRAKQWQEEAQKARQPRNGDTNLQIKAQLDEPPPLTPPVTATMRVSPVVGEQGQTRKRPHDMPDTDVDGRCNVAQSSSDETIQAHSGRVEGGESAGRKKARFEGGLEHQ